MGAAPEIKRAWPIVSMITLIGLGAINIFLSLVVVPKFEQIFQEALPGQILPGITTFIISARIPLALIALAWPITGVLAVWQRHRAAIWIIYLGFLYFFALIGVTVFALFIPMVGGPRGLSDAPPTSAASGH